MKRILSLLLVLCLVFSFAGCKKDSDEFVKPENYATVLFIRINPELNLYLDISGKTLAIEPLNDDAKELIADYKPEEAAFQDVIKDIVTAANEKGFVKEDAQISIKVTESKLENSDVDDILSKADTVVSKTATSLGIEVKVEKITGSADIDVSSTTETESSKVDESSKTETSSKTDVSSKTNGSAKPGTSSKPSGSANTNVSSKPAHTHSFSAATCTAPKKCSCGATEGKALGHKYTEGVCERCKAKDPNFKYQSVSTMNGKWYSTVETGDGEISEYRMFIFPDFPENIAFDVGVYFTEKRLIEEGLSDSLDNPSITYNGETYYIVGGGFAVEGTIKENNDKIVVDNTYCRDSVKHPIELQRISTNSIKVTVSDSSCDASIPVNTIFNFIKE